MNCPLNQAVICTNWICTHNGCQKLCGVTLPVTSDQPNLYRRVVIGCICPPTSEQTCMNPDCGRKPRDRQV